MSTMTSDQLSKIETQIVGELIDLAEQSRLSWEMAIDTAGPEYDGGSEDRADKAREDAEGCAEAYEAAIECARGMYANWSEECRGHLLDAKRLESEWGDCSEASAAIRALDEYLGELAEEEAAETEDATVETAEAQS